MSVAFEEKTSKRNNTEPSVFCIEMERTAPISGVLPHYHDYIEILYAIDCNLSVWINDDEFPFSTGELIVINSREAHEVYAKDENCGKYFVIKFSPEILRFEGQPTDESRCLIPLLQNDLSGLRRISAKEAKASKIKSIIENVAEEWNLNSFAGSYALRGEVLSLFTQIVRIWEKRCGDSLFVFPDEVSETIFAVTEYCSENFANITEKEVAKLFAMSYSYFSRTFKRVMNKSFTSYLTDLKLDFARNLLLTTNLSITQIAQEAGFSTTSHFISSFRKKTGFSPLAYKKKLLTEI